MWNVSKWRSVLAVIFLCAITAGCQQVAKQTNQSDKSKQAGVSAEGELVQQIKNLKTLGSLWHSYQDQYRTGPANWEELIAFGKNNPALSELRDSGFVVTGWGLRFADVTIGISNFVLAYSPEAKQDKGPILLMDGFVREMSAAELQTALEDQQAVGARK